MKVGQKVTILEGKEEFTKIRKLVGKIGTIEKVRNNGVEQADHQITTEDGKAFWLLEDEFELVMDCPRAKAI